VTDAESACRELEHRGLEIVSPLVDHAGRRSFCVADPDGNWLELWDAANS
jgi:predicted enzyme related to lactoylglutathione lyase